MAEMVVSQSHLWLTVTELLERQHTMFLHLATETADLFGTGSEQNLDLVKSEKEAGRITPYEYSQALSHTSSCSHSLFLQKQVAVTNSTSTVTRRKSYI